MTTTDTTQPGAEALDLIEALRLIAEYQEPGHRIADDSDLDYVRSIASEALARRATPTHAVGVPSETVEMLNEVADLLVEKNWRGDLTEALRDFAKGLATPPASQACGEPADASGSGVMPPFAAPASQHEAGTSVLTDDEIVGICEEECGWLGQAPDSEIVKFARAIEIELASRGRNG